MSSSIPYGAFANYSPRGSSDLSKNSRTFCGLVKNGKIDLIPIRIGTSDPPTRGNVGDYLRTETAQVLEPFLNENVTLVPVPRSAPLADGALWPSKVIADFLLSEGFGKEVSTLIERVHAVQKSSSQFSADSRPSVKDHYESFRVNPELSVPTQITLIDDVLTLGRTTYACAQRLQEAFPEAVIRIFVMVRTQGFIPDVEKIIDPSIGEVRYNPNTGKTSRIP